MTHNQKKLLRIKLHKESNNLKENIEKIISNHLLNENETVDKKEDYQIEKDINNTLVEYILNTSSDSYGEAINKYNVSNYYTELAKVFNRLAKKRKLSRNKLWKMIKKNKIFKYSNKTELRIYKYIFRGEIIPSPKFVYKTLNKHNILPSYSSILYLNELEINELKCSYKLLVVDKS